jgi:hypothetical protein
LFRFDEPHSAVSYVSGIIYIHCRKI